MPKGYCIPISANHLKDYADSTKFCPIIIWWVKTHPTDYYYIDNDSGQAGMTPFFELSDRLMRHETRDSRHESCNSQLSKEI